MEKEPLDLEAAKLLAAFLPLKSYFGTVCVHYVHVALALWKQPLPMERLAEVTEIKLHVLKPLVAAWTHRGLTAKSARGTTAVVSLTTEAVRGIATILAPMAQLQPAE